MAKLIVIDAGHGGTGKGGDPGAIGITGRQEKDFNLSVALKLRDILKKNKAFEVKLTRDTDVFIELKKRSDLANKWKADAFISIHANKSGNTSAEGYETLYTRNESKKLADIIHSRVYPVTGFRNRGSKTQNLSVCRLTKMPAILLEAGFLSNPIEEATLFSEGWQLKYAQAIYQGLCDYFGVDAEVHPVEKPSGTVPYVKLQVTVNQPQPQHFTGYSINNSTWIPSRPIGELLGGHVDYIKGSVSVNGKVLDTKIIDNVGYVQARELGAILGAKVFWGVEDKHKVEIYPK